MLMLGSDGIRRLHRPPENHATFLLPNLRESRLPWIHEAAHAGPPRLPPPVRLHGWMGSTPSTHPSEKKLPQGSSSVLGAWMQRYPLRSVGDIVGLSPRCSAHTRGRARLRWTGGAWETPRACSHGVATGGASHVAREIRNGRVRRTRTWWRLTTTNDRTTRCLLKPRGMRGHARTRREVVTTCDGKGGVRATTLAESPTVSEEGLGSAKSVSAVILGGGAGTRLYPLTKSRAKPAVPIGGAYRLIDVPMSNCINSGIKKIYILTQFNSTSLNRHLARTYNFGSGIRVGGAGFVEVLAATQTPESTPGGKDWFRGTADAVRQYSWLFTDIKNKDIEDVLILSGDHLYRMDYMDFVRKHRESGAGITVGCLPVDHSRASDFGLMKIDDTGRIIEFAEKPKGDALEAMKVDTAVLGLSREEANLSPFIASMGIYVFKKSVLLDLLMKDFPLALDFGSEILPAASKSHKVQAYLFNDYWEDIGTIKSFFDANLALTQQPPRFEFYDPDNPIYTSPRFLPPAKIKKSHVVDSIISHGCFLQECSVEHSIIGLRSRVEKGADIKDTMLIGADFYESKEQRDSLLAAGKVPIGVGQNCVLRNCIADKNARIGRDCVIVNKDGIEEANREDEGLYIRSGIVTVLRNATVHPGTVI